MHVTEASNQGFTVSVHDSDGSTHGVEGLNARHRGSRARYRGFGHDIEGSDYVFEASAQEQHAV